MTSEILNTLSDEDLSAIADRMGLHLPSDLERIFVAEEILEAIEEDSQEHGSEVPLYFEDAKYWSGDKRGLPAGAEPKLEPRYNETMIKALVRDPSWAFALWDISDSDRLGFDISSEDHQLFLRITELGGVDGERALFFDIPVKPDDLQWYINLPHPEARYRIDLAIKTGSRLRVLARSFEFFVPRQRNATSDPGPAARRLLELSGIHDLDIEEPEEENPARILRFDSSGMDR